MEIVKKEIKPGTWRYLGQRLPSIWPSSVPIAGHSIEAIKRNLDGDCYKIGRFKTINAFLLIVKPARLLYVRPDYSGYLNVAKRVFPSVDWKVDFDHALSRRIACSAHPPYKYVLLIRVPPTVNRAHGSFEKKDQFENGSPEVCFADDRVLDKWLGRPPKSRNRPVEVMAGYSPHNTTKYGLSLKQAGKFAYAIGMDDYDLRMEDLHRFDP